jgi:hypothetical protein
MAADSFSVHSSITFWRISFMNNMNALSGFLTYAFFRSRRAAAAAADDDGEGPNSDRHGFDDDGDVDDNADGGRRQRGSAADGSRTYASVASSPFVRSRNRLECNVRQSEQTTRMCSAF